MTGKNWDDDYEMPCFIYGVEHYVENGVPVYSVKIHTDYYKLDGGPVETRVSYKGGIVETRIKEYK